MKVKIEAFETYPAGVYPATVKEITEDTESQFGAQYRFKFSLGGALDGKTMTGWCRQSGSVKSKFFEWYTALTGKTPKPGEVVETDELIGKTAQLVIKVKRNDDGTEKNVIDSVLPMQAQAAQHSDPITMFWKFANDHKIGKQDAAAYIAETGGDFERALQLMQAQTVTA
jgi:hypothetical protein